MMTFSVGILYSSQNFLKLVKDNEINSLDFPDMFKKFYVVADAKTVLETSLECKWVTLKENNHLKLTKRGEAVLFPHQPFQRLRVQLAYLIETYKPSWAPLITFGRAEAVKYFSSEVKQCFSEAYLLEGYDQDVIEWWDKLAIATRGFHDDVRLELGRKGELLSIQYEKDRTGVAPIWQSIESNFSGYDLLSQMDDHNLTPLRIEVKATNTKNEISFIITKGEWNVAINSKSYIFHIWSLNPYKELFIFTQDDMSRHIPVNEGKGLWESVQVTFARDEIIDYRV
ncbi:hypothetical protein CA600_08365 [Paenibacillus sp. VTT E-133280]|jgi:hypothetical protein|uniref:protein NO VEIN domain-containing protein n=1 Tax=Paenibacillus sp. VTT E-133280 TaxID=1986222 RepID=UPI000BA0F4A7|nr:DUF3883 domain-containing protein [Paenibacillus sp. VTT E-133280]OZQ67680.1 hypothetical protein CA600_08365 [Paenibacillus sp. VTT E-133280]